MLKTLKNLPKHRGAKVLTSKQYEQRIHAIPAIWHEVAGSLKGKLTEDPVVWQRRIRQESEVRLARQVRIARDGARQ